MAWVEKLHAAGLYRARMAYPHLNALAMELLLPLPLNPPEHTKAEASVAQTPIAPPEHARPQIAEVQARGAECGSGLTCSGIGRSGSRRTSSLLSRLSTFPGANVYWMGAEYLGNNIWAADIMLPTPSTLRIDGEGDDAEGGDRVLRRGSMRMRSRAQVISSGLRRSWC